MKSFVLYTKYALTMALMGAASAYGGANPSIGWSYGTIVATPHYPIVGEPAEIAVVVTNPGDAPASNVQVKISFNDWGVTFQGWQEIETITVPSIPAGGSITVQATHSFETRAHTCLEALVIGADENTNPDDDRGQINLEIINAGETFSWDVPVVNNGDQPLHLLIAAHCRRGDAAGNNGAIGCRDDRQVVVEPGEELLVPIQLDLRDFAIGEELEFEVNAFDLGAGPGAFLPQNRNHIIMRIVRQTARSLETAARANAANLAAAQGNNKNKKTLEQAAKALDQALAANWINDNKVAPGANAFAHTENAVKHLLAALDGGLSRNHKIAVDTLARNLTDAARILAISNNASPASLKPGDDHRTAGNYSQAIKAYKQAAN